MDRRKAELVQTAQAAFSQGLFSGTSGNLSIFCRAEGVMLITPTGARYETMTAADVVTVALDGTVQGVGKPSSEWRLHACLYEKLPQVNAVVHTHSPYATAFAVANRSIPATLIEMFHFLGGAVDCAPYATPGTAAVGEGVLPLLQGGKGGCLLANHGVVAVGPTLARARLRAEYIEEAARVYALAKAIGEPVVLERL